MPNKQAKADGEHLRKQIEERAYALGESDGKMHGRHLDHWLKAESEIAASRHVGATPSIRREEGASNTSRKKAEPSIR